MGGVKNTAHTIDHIHNRNAIMSADIMWQLTSRHEIEVFYTNISRGCTLNIFSIYYTFSVKSGPMTYDYEFDMINKQLPCNKGCFTIFTALLLSSNL